MKIQPTKIDGLFVVETNSFVDLRGSFTRIFCQDELETIIGDRKIVQINHSLTKKIAAIRGLHFQHPPYSEMKLIRCLRGRVWDVAVDLRAGSSTLLQWHAEELSANTSKTFIIPEGFAHGFQVLENDSELIYFSTAFYNPSLEGGISYNDPRLKISWPLPVKDISIRDSGFLPLKMDYCGISL